MSKPDGPATITDSAGSVWELVEFFDHDSQQILVALRFKKAAQSQADVKKEDGDD